MQNQTSSLLYLKYLTTAFDNINEGVVLVAIEEGEVYRMLLANSAFHKISGYSLDSVGKEVGEISTPEGFDYLTTRYRKVRETRKPLEYIRWSNVPAGRRAYEVRMVPVMNNLDEVVQIVAIIRDVTMMLKLKEEVQELRAKVAAKD